MRIFVTGGAGFIGSALVRHKAVRAAIDEFEPDVITHLSAESHVDRSIDGSGAFVQTLRAILDELRPRAEGQPYDAQMTEIADRPGHDKRYAIDASRIDDELGWTPAETFKTGIHQTVEWYLTNESWWRPLVADKAATRRGVGA